MTAYRYTHGDGSVYWDCYTAKKYVGRAHSWIEVTIIAVGRGLNISSIKEIL